MSAKGSSDDQPDKPVVFTKAHLTLYQVVLGVQCQTGFNDFVYLKFFSFFIMSVE